MEKIGQNIFLNFIDKEKFDIFDTNEGSKADLLIRPKMKNFG